MLARIRRRGRCGGQRLTEPRTEFHGLEDPLQDIVRRSALAAEAPVDWSDSGLSHRESSRSITIYVLECLRFSEREVGHIVDRQEIVVDIFVLQYTYGELSVSVLGGEGYGFVALGVGDTLGVVMVMWSNRYILGILPPVACTS